MTKFVNHVQDSENMEAEEVFNTMMSDKVGAALEAKRMEMAKPFVSKDEKQVED